MSEGEGDTISCKRQHWEVTVQGHKGIFVMIILYAGFFLALEQLYIDDDCNKLW